MLGSVDYKILTSFNVYSADSSGAARASSMGQLRTPIGTFLVGNKRSDPQHIYNQNPEKIEQLDNYLKTLGYTIRDITGDDLGTSRKRLEVTILSYKDMMKRIQKNKRLIDLPSRREIMKLPYSKIYGSYLVNGKFPSKGEWK